MLNKVTFQEQVYVGEFAAGGTRLKPPQRLTRDESSDQPMGWTPDSKSVLFASNRNGSGIFRQGIGQDTAEPVFTAGPNAGPPILFHLSPDGAWILFVESPTTPANPEAPSRLMRIPVSGGGPQFLLNSPNLSDFDCARPPASRCILLEDGEDRKQLLISTFDPLKGREKLLRTIGQDPAHDYGTAGISPDGSMLALSSAGKVGERLRVLIGRWTERVFTSVLTRPKAALFSTLIWREMRACYGSTRRGAVQSGAFLRGTAGTLRFWATSPIATPGCSKDSE